MHQVLLQYLDCCRTKASEQLIRGAPHRRSPKVAFYGDTFVRPSSRGALVASLKCRHPHPHPPAAGHRRSDRVEKEKNLLRMKHFEGETVR
jgi:hypothetical protein